MMKIYVKRRKCSKGGRVRVDNQYMTPVAVPSHQALQSEDGEGVWESGATMPLLHCDPSCDISGTSADSDSTLWSLVLVVYSCWNIGETRLICPLDEAHIAPWW